jgi:hypothetical protein
MQSVSLALGVVKLCSMVFPAAKTHTLPNYVTLPRQMS